MGNTLRQTFWDNSIDSALDFRWNREAIRDAIANGGAHPDGHAGLPSLGMPHGPYESDGAPGARSLATNLHALHTGSEDNSDRPLPTIAGSQSFNFAPHAQV